MGEAIALTDTEVRRFVNKITVGHPAGCWEWVGSRDRHGYGQFCRSRNGGSCVRLKAHRVSWMLLRGPIPDGLEIDHLCRNPSCLNPAHLEPVTHRENMRRSPFQMISILRGPDYQRAKTHCPHGHPYDEANTGHTKSAPNSRYCRACARERMRARRPA